MALQREHLEHFVCSPVLILLETDGTKCQKQDPLSNPGVGSRFPQ